jgi:cyanophycin synthetase
VIAAQTVGLDVAGIDVIAEDISRPLEAQHGAVIEVNASPGLVMHLKPLSGKPRPVGEAIVDHLFPPDENGRVPLVAVSGTTGKAAVTALLAAMLTAAGRKVGSASSTGLRVGSRVLSAQDAASAASARRLLQNPFVDAIVLETCEQRVVSEGLVFDRCQVAVVTDLRPHAGVEEQQAVLVEKAVRAPVDVVLAEGFAALNASDARVAAMADKCRGRVVYFAAGEPPALIREHIDTGGPAVFVSGGHLVAVQKGVSSPIASLDLLGGRSPAEDVVAAVAGGVALGLTSHAIRQGIETALRQLPASA